MHRLFSTTGVCAMSPKYTERQSFAFPHCSQVFRRVTWEQKVCQESLSRCPGGRFCKTRRTQVFWSSGRSTGRILLPVAVQTTAYGVRPPAVRTTAQPYTAGRPPPPRPVNVNFAFVKITCARDVSYKYPERLPSAEVQGKWLHLRVKPAMERPV